MTRLPGDIIIGNDHYTYSAYTGIIPAWFDTETLGLLAGMLLDNSGVFMFPSKASTKRTGTRQKETERVPVDQDTSQQRRYIYLPHYPSTVCAPRPFVNKEINVFQKITLLYLGTLTDDLQAVCARLPVITIKSLFLPVFIATWSENSPTVLQYVFHLYE